MDKIINEIRKELKNSADEKTKAGFQRFFKESVKFYGVKTGIVSKIAKKYWQEVKKYDKQKIFSLCEELYRSGYCEEAFIVSSWAEKIDAEQKDFPVFKSWIGKYINNWAECDGFCNHTIGNFIQKYPQYIKELKTWTNSKNRWMKRAAAVSLIVPAKKGLFLKDVIEIADILLLDPDDMVQKGYGWMLKEASRKHEKEVLDRKSTRLNSSHRMI
jgi:3-methyladenine DNA glycosylase AlkD